VATSGSSGEPKGVLLSADALRASARATHEVLAGPGTWVLALPTWHVAGLQVLVRSVVADTTPVELDLARGFDPFALVAPRVEGPVYTSLVPTQLLRAFDAGVDLSGFDAVLLGGAAASSSLLERARLLGVRVVTTYGSSETSGGCVYDGVPLPGVSVTLREGDDRILVGGPTLFSGYRQQTGSTDAFDSAGRFVTSDVGRWANGSLLEVLGRADDLIVTGGEKVAPRLVEEALELHPHVRQAAVVPREDAEWGQAVVAYVVGRPGSPAPALEELRSWVADRVSRAAAPRDVRILSALPLLPGGKLDRQALRLRARTQEG